MVNFIIDQIREIMAKKWRSISTLTRLAPSICTLKNKKEIQGV